MTGLELTHKWSTCNSVIKTKDFPSRNASGRASIALRRSAKAVSACQRWSPPVSCTCTCGVAVDAILHSFKNAQVVTIEMTGHYLDNDLLVCVITGSLFHSEISTLSDIASKKGLSKNVQQQDLYSTKPVPAIQCGLHCHVLFMW